MLLSSGRRISAGSLTHIPGRGGLFVIVSSVFVVVVVVVVVVSVSISSSS